MATPQDSLAALKTQFDAETAKGYHGAKVDPNPNSAYSQETDPMTSPGVIPYYKSQFQIDEWADPANPEYDNIHHTRAGITVAEAALLRVRTIDGNAPAVAVAINTQTTALDVVSPFDGDFTGATITAVVAITADATNNRKFVLRNETKGRNQYEFTTSTALAAGAAVVMSAVSGANLAVSEEDEFSIVETVNGTGQAHGGVHVIGTINQAA